MKRFGLIGSAAFIPLLILISVNTAIGLGQSANIISVVPSSGVCTGGDITLSGPGMPAGQVSVRMVVMGASGYTDAPLGSATADASGNWSLTTTVPAQATNHWKDKLTAEDMFKGNWKLEAIGSDGSRSIGEITILGCVAESRPAQPIRQNTTASPSDGACIGETMTISGTGATPDVKQDVLVQDIWSDENGLVSRPLVKGNPVSDANGNWSMQFIVPATIYSYAQKANIATPVNSSYGIRVNVNPGNMSEKRINGGGTLTVRSCPERFTLISWLLQIVKLIYLVGI